MIKCKYLLIHTLLKWINRHYWYNNFKILTTKVFYRFECCVDGKNNMQVVDQATLFNQKQFLEAVL